MTTGTPFISSRYRIDREIGRGGMGSVYLGLDTILDRRVAIKVLNSAHLDAPSAIPRFIQEGRVCAQLRSENAVKIFDLGVNERGQPFLVMEYLDGKDLAQELKANGKMPFQFAASYILQAASALAEAHALAVVHRDLKPHNLFLTHVPGSQDRVVKVLDFGLSRLPKNTAFTASGELLGTPAYMSPEQVEGRTDIDARADIWALGVILYELVSGVRPFAGETIPHTTHRILYEQPPSLSSLAPGVPPGFGAIVQRCMQKNPAARYTNVGELTRDLAAFAPGVSGRASYLPMPPSTPAYPGPSMAPGGAPYAYGAPMAGSAYPAVHAATGDVSLPSFSSTSQSATVKHAKGGTSLFLVGSLLGIGVVALAGLGIGAYFLFVHDEAPLVATGSSARPKGSATADDSLASTTPQKSAANGAPGALPALVTADAGRGGSAPGPSPSPNGLFDAGGGGVTVVDAGGGGAPSGAKVTWVNSINWEAGYTQALIHKVTDGPVVACMNTNQAKLEAAHPKWREGVTVTVDYDLDGTILYADATGWTVLAEIVRPCLKASFKGKTFGPPMRQVKLTHVTLQVQAK